MYTSGEHKMKMLMKFLITLIPIGMVLFIVDMIARTSYNTSLPKLLEEFLKNVK